MDKVLIVSSNDSAASAITTLIKKAFPACSVSLAATGSESRRAAAVNDYDAVIINCPLTDEVGGELAEHIVQTTCASCVMIVKTDISDAVSEKMEDSGVMVVEKPIVRQVFYQALKFVNASRKRMLGLQTENVRLHKRLEEMRIINRAKFALMQYLGFSEAQAHRYIEKQAMDMRKTKVEIAYSVINTYE